MTDRLEALERLQRLRESGAISEAEFEREKALLLGGAPASPAAPPLPVRRGTPLWVWVLIGVISVAVIAALAWLLLGRNESRDEDEDRVEVNVQADTNQQSKAEPDDDIPAIRRRPEREQLAAAFRAAFGERTTRNVGEADITFRPGSLTWIGDRAVLVSPGTNSEECHVCAGMVAVHYLEAADDGFRRTGEWLDVATDDYGRPPEWRITSDLTGRPALRVANGGGNQGIFCNFVSYYDFAQGGPREIVRVQTGYTDEGAATEEGAGTELEGEIRNIRPGRSFEVAYSGDQSFTERYELRGAGFVLVPGPTRVPEC